MNGECQIHAPAAVSRGKVALMAKGWVLLGPEPVWIQYQGQQKEYPVEYMTL